MDNSKLSHCKRVLFCTLEVIKAIPVIFLIAIIGWSYYAYIVCVCAYFVQNAYERVLYIILYHAVLGIFLWCYVQTIFTQPIGPPKQFYLNYTETEKYLTIANSTDQQTYLEQLIRDKQLPVQTRAINGTVRFCDTCFLIKPDRAHHCSTCGKCLLKMDHHCPWVNNCVGFHNYKYFVLFLGYGFLYCIYINATSLKYFIQFWTMDSPGSTSITRFHVLFLFLVALIFAVSLMFLWAYHVWLTCKNRSTLESYRAPVLVSGPRKDAFHLGYYRNFLEVFGDQRKLWFLPLFTTQGSGITFRTRGTLPLDRVGLLEDTELGPESTEESGILRATVPDGGDSRDARESGEEENCLYDSRQMRLTRK